MEYVSDVYTINISTGVPNLSRGATIKDDWQVNFACGGAMSGVSKGRDFWTDPEEAWKGNKSVIAEKIKFHKRQLAKLSQAFLVPRQAGPS